MVMALGVGAWTAAVFHLFTHAFFKALLFLGAGSVSHSGSHHSFDMKDDMGGLRKFMPDHVLDVHHRHARARRHLPARRLLVEGRDPRDRGRDRLRGRSSSSGLIGAFLTAAYMTRCVYLTFFGEYRGHGHPHESEQAITDPAHHPRGLLGLAGLPQRGAARHREVQGVGRADGRVPDARPRRVRLSARRRSRWPSPRSGIGVASFFCFKREETGRAQGPHRAQRARTRRLHAPREASTTSTTSTRRSSSARSRARSRAASTGSTRT